jgi:hypothetical protein
VNVAAPEVFELELVGGDVLRAYRTMRPEVEAMPWGTLDPARYPAELVLAARTSWTGAAFQEHRTGAACAATLRVLIEARAPLDLIALATRFPLDEMVHVELCARMAMELGGAIELRYQPDEMLASFGEGEAPLVRAAHLVVAYFCVGEAISIPLLQGTARAATHDLTRAVLRRIVLDEADHGQFGWIFLDWALPLLDDAARAALAVTAGQAIAALQAAWADVRARRVPDDTGIHDLGWLGSDDYLRLAARGLERQCLRPLAERGISVP